MKTFTTAPDEVLEIIRHRRAEFYKQLDEAGVTFAVLMVKKDGSGPALSAGGYPALAMIGKQAQHIRAAGGADVLLQIDLKRWAEMEPGQRIALIDHELHHLEVHEDTDASTGFELDPQGRPKITIRKHDYQFGWFTEIAARHGKNSPEVTQARLMWDEDGQRLFPFLEENLQLEA